MWLGSPSRPRPRPPRHGLAREVPAPPPARGVRTGLPRWLALTHEDPDIGRGARPARPPAPHARARLGCRTSRRVRAEGGPPGTSAPTIHPPAPIRPRRWPHDGPAREVPAPPPARDVRTPPARSDGRDGRDAIQCVRTHRRAAARDDTADREVDSHPSAHMGRTA